jgi:hypothetical protein|tara:strand:+ start:741 stop:1247 length:507 start_codon:yes stop_codon:yes gene_type:complete
MIQQRPGDILEVEYEDKFYYLVVVTKIFMFGGNIVYAFHGSGSKIDNFCASARLDGFNICTDLLLPKKEGSVTRIGKVDDPKEFLTSSLIKGCHEHRPGKTAEEWWISTVDSPSEYIARVKSLTLEQSKAMDSGMYSFDLTAKKILESYTPNKNMFIKKRRGIFGVFS